jgi:hypothetical protein
VFGLLPALMVGVLTQVDLRAAEAIPIQCRPGERAIVTVEALSESGKPRLLRMILDTGAELCVVDEASAHGLVNGAFRLLEAGGFAGRRRHAMKRTLRQLRLGSVSQPSVPVLVMDLVERNKWMDEPVDGLLGMSFLAGRRFLVDPQRGCLVWDGQLPGGRVVAREVEALADTGATGTLYLGSMPRRLALDGDCELGGGIDGFVRLGKGRADLEVFGETFPRRPLWIGGSSTAILGAFFLLAGPTVFDFRAQKIELSQEPGGRLVRAPALPEEVSVPVCWNRKGKVPCLEVAPMPACHRWLRAGFRPGDRVLSVGSIPGGELTLARINTLIRDGQIRVWTLQRGEKVLELSNPREDRRDDRLEEE